MSGHGTDKHTQLHKPYLLSMHIVLIVHPSINLFVFTHLSVRIAFYCLLGWTTYYVSLLLPCILSFPSFNPLSRTSLFPPLFPPLCVAAVSTWLNRCCWQTLSMLSPLSTLTLFTQLYYCLGFPAIFTLRSSLFN